MNVIVSNKYQSLLASLNIDVIKSINGEFTVEELVSQFQSFYFNKMIIDITAIKGYEEITVMQNLSVNFDMSKVILLLDDSEKVNSPVYISQLISMGIYNFTSDIITEHAGATTLIYLLKLHLEKAYNVKAVEIDKNDFIYFNDNTLESVSSLGFNDFLSNNTNYDIILVDLNDGNVSEYCHDIIYLIEPGLIKLNKLIREDNAIFTKLNEKKIVLNRSVLDTKDVQDFEKESGSKVFFNMPCLDDKLDDQMVVNAFLTALGFSRIDANGSSGIFSIFK